MPSLVVSSTAGGDGPSALCALCWPGAMGFGVLFPVARVRYHSGERPLVGKSFDHWLVSHLTTPDICICAFFFCD